MCTNPLVVKGGINRVHIKYQHNFSFSVVYGLCQFNHAVRFERVRTSQFLFVPQLLVVIIEGQGQTWGPDVKLCHKD